MKGDVLRSESEKLEPTREHLYLPSFYAESQNVDHLTRLYFFENFSFFLCKIRWDEHHHALSKCFLCRVAEQTFRSCVPRHDGPIWLFGINGIMSVLDNGCQVHRRF